MDSQLSTRIMKSVDANFDRQVDFLAALVGCASLRGDEEPAQDLMQTAMTEAGLAIDRWRLDEKELCSLRGYSPVETPYDGVSNVAGVWRPRGRKGRSLILNGHVDVVPAGPLDKWTSPPFAARIADGWMYGRGAADMKGGVSAMVFALEALRCAGLRPAAEVAVHSVVEEECTGNGALACIARGYRADAVLIPEPRNGAVTSAQLGVMWLRVTVRGRPAHVREAQIGANAIEAAFPLMAALHRLEAEWNAPSRRHPAFAGLDHPINFNLGRIAGGDWPSSVPAWCVLEIRVAVYPNQSLDDAKAEIESCLRKAGGDAISVEYHGFMAEGYELINADAPLGVLERAHAAAGGGELARVPTTACTDARFYGLYGGMPSLVYGPRGAAIHGFDERVELESLRTVTQAIALFVAEWCGVEAA
jgi:acetylornithine deacetylase